MFRRLSFVCVAVCTFVLLCGFNVTSVSAHAMTASQNSRQSSHTTSYASTKSLSCPSYYIGGSRIVGAGNTTASVTLLVWKNCQGKFYVSATITSYKGFAYKGVVSIARSNGQISSTVCNGAGTCNSPAVSAPIKYSEYRTTNGSFDGLGFKYWTFPGKFTAFGAVNLGNSIWAAWHN